MSTDSGPGYESGEWTTPRSISKTWPSVQRSGNTYGAKPEPVRTLLSQYRTAKISADIDGNALPVAIVLSPDDLKEMGVAPDETDAIEYRFDENHLIIRSAD